MVWRCCLNSVEERWKEKGKAERERGREQVVVPLFSFPILACALAISTVSHLAQSALLKDASQLFSALGMNSDSLYEFLSACSYLKANPILQLLPLFHGSHSLSLTPTLTTFLPCHPSLFSRPLTRLSECETRRRRKNKPPPPPPVAPPKTRSWDLLLALMNGDKSWAACYTQRSLDFVLSLLWP